MPAQARRQLIVHRFGPEASFEGQLVGALERAEAERMLRVIEVLFIARDPETDEIVAIDERARDGGFAVEALSFRLDERERRAATERALQADAAGTAAVLLTLSDTLGPGDAIAAVLFEHGAPELLPDPISESAGSRVANELVDAEALADLSELLLAARDAAG